MAVNYQLVIDCTDPEWLARFWVPLWRYEPEPPPAGFATCDEYWRDVGVPEEDLGLGVERISDPGGAGPHIWFQVVPNASCNEARIGVTSRGYWRLPVTTAGLGPASGVE